MRPYPKNFDWGIASSAYQIEGGYAADGKGLNIWDVFSHMPGKIAGGGAGDVCADHYHLWKEDIQLIAAMGVKSYRLSTSWARILPNGTGKVNQKGLDFYSRIIDHLLEAGIEPVVNLHHYDLPYALYQQGGWPCKNTIHAYEEYAELLFDTLGDRVKRWITVNDVRGTLLGGYLTGERAPGRKGELKAAVQGWHNMHVACASVVARWKERNVPHSEIGGVMGVLPVYPADETPEALALANQLWLLYNEAFLTPMLRGIYPDDISPLLENHGILPEVSTEEQAIMIKGVADFIGISYYTPMRVQPNPNMQAGDFMRAFTLAPNEPVTQAGWEIYPEGLYDAIMKIHTLYHPKIYIAETGAAFADSCIINGIVQDDDRITFLEKHFKQVQRALCSGANVCGVHVWTFLDNFEWQHGFTKKFGLISVDKNTLKRTPKKSAGWYTRYIAKHTSSIL